MALSTLETCFRAVSQQIQHLRMQRRPRPSQLQHRVDRLLWRCCQEMTLDRFQVVFEAIGDPLSDLHVLIRNQAYARHGRLDSIRSLLQQRPSPTTALQMIKWSSSLPDMSLLLQVWAQHSIVVKTCPETLWKLAIVLSGCSRAQAEFVELLADVLAAVATRSDSHDDRLVHFLYDCILRYSSSAGLAAGTQLSSILQQTVGSARLLSKLKVLLLEDERCLQSQEFARQWTNWC